MLADTAHRVERNTADEINRARQDEIRQRLDFYAMHPEQVPARLGELDREWDIERALEANAATVALTGLTLAAFVDRRFIALPFAVAGFLLQHAVQGWCPPVPVLRRLGFRTATEIADERCRLRMLQAEPGEIGQPAPSRLLPQLEDVHEGVEA